MPGYDAAVSLHPLRSRGVCGTAGGCFHRLTPVARPAARRTGADDAARALRRRAFPGAERRHRLHRIDQDVRLSSRSAASGPSGRLDGDPRRTAVRRSGVRFAVPGSCMVARRRPDSRFDGSVRTTRRSMSTHRPGPPHQQQVAAGSMPAWSPDGTDTHSCSGAGRNRDDQRGRHRTSAAPVRYSSVDNADAGRRTGTPIAFSATARRRDGQRGLRHPSGKRRGDQADRESRSATRPPIGRLMAARTNPPSTGRLRASG